MTYSKDDQLNKIRQNWVSNSINEQACIDFWNSFATNQKEFEIPTFENNSFLKLLKEEQMLNDNGCSLDIGCGTGKYSFALSKNFKELVGFDISNEMLKKARKKADEIGIDNIKFICSKWEDFDIKEAGFEHKFDLVFAHMTPAIGSAISFEKMIEASKGYCAMSKPTRRINPIMDKIMNSFGMDKSITSADEDILYTFEYLWNKGYCPKMDYENQVWKSQRKLSQATEMYINRAKQYKNLSLNDKDNICDIVKSFEKDGEVYEVTNTLITTIYWQV